MGYIKQYTNYTIHTLRGKSGVYIITNNINGMYYIGGAIDFYNRFRLHIGDLLKNKHFNIHLQRSVNKYGIDNFSFEILQEYSKNIVFEMETMWILLLNATNKNCGYNLNNYAGTRKGSILSEETRNKISKSLSKDPNWSSEKRIIRNYKTSYRIEPIIQLSLEGTFIKEWDNVNDITKELKIISTNIVANAKGKIKTCHFFIFKYKSDYNPKLNYSTTRGKFLKKVGKYSLSDELLEVFDNGTIASDSINGNQANVNAVCNNYGKNKTYKGYKWKFINEETAINFKKTFNNKIK